MKHRIRAALARPGAAAALAAVLLLLFPSRPSAHEIPARVTILAFVKPEASRLRLVIRVPLEAMRDIDFPTRGTGAFLDIERATPLLNDAARLWITDYLKLYEEGTPLVENRIVATRISLPSDRAFETLDAALLQLGASPLPPTTELPWQQAMLDVLLEYPITSERSRFSIHPALAHLGIRTSTVLRFLPPVGGERVFQYAGDPGIVRLDPRWHQAALRFVGLGFMHILDGIDHLLFILCLVIPVRRVRPLIAIVTSFTVGHSITLIASAFGVVPGALWFPPLIETLIALSIVYMAFENIIGARLERRWIIAFGFGLVHGFGFAFVLRESLQFGGTHLITSLLTFNIGVELGQLLVLTIAIPVLDLLFRRVVAERIGTILLSALVAHTAWHWMLERGGVLGDYQFVFPAMDAALLAGVMRAAMVVLIVVGAWWGLAALFGRSARGVLRGRDGEL